MIKAGITGICGRMGSVIARTICGSEGIELGGALEIEGHQLCDHDASVISGITKKGIIITSDMDAAFNNCDVIIDFTSPESSLKTAAYALEHKKALVIGTTGLTPPQIEELKKVASTIPVVFSPNMSIGVNVLLKILGKLTAALGDSYDIDIVEAHHKHKKDAPSGTAKALALSVAEARGVKLDDVARYERNGIIGERPLGEIGLQSVRAGDIVGDHTVFFAGPGERIEVTHRAHSRENFANGALRAALWIADKKPGFYNMQDVLGINK